MEATGSFVNMMMDRSKSLTPVVGMGVTELCWTDRHAHTIIEVKSSTRIVVQRDKATRTDKNGMSEDQTYTFERNPDGVTHVLSLRKNGRWIRVGDSMGGCTWSPGHRSEYYDFSL